MREPQLGDSVLYATAKGDPDQVAIVTAVGVEDEDAGTKLSDCWLTVLPAGAAPFGLLEPVAYDADGKTAGTWRWADGHAPDGGHAPDDGQEPTPKPTPARKTTTKAPTA